LEHVSFIPGTNIFFISQTLSECTR
jgi:hypothetical protein